MIDTPCILWPGATSLGYGKLDTKLAHRLIWELACGPLPQGFVVHHECRVKLCVNLTHLLAMPQADHIAMHAREHGGAANARKTHCPRGHAYDKVNTYRYRNMRMCIACRKSRR